jgi:hypothetical protein
VVSFQRRGLAGFAASSQLSGIWQAQLVLIGHCASRPGFLRSACSVLNNSTAPAHQPWKPHLQGWLPISKVRPTQAHLRPQIGSGRRPGLATSCSHVRARRTWLLFFMTRSAAGHASSRPTCHASPIGTRRDPPDCHSISSRLGLSQQTSLCWSLPCDPYAARCAATLRALMQLQYGRHHQ